MTKIKDVTTLVKTKFVGLYDVEYENKNSDIRHWMVASRKDEKNLKEIYINYKEDKIDAVVIAAYHKSEKEVSTYKTI